nr:MAG TPA: ParB protein [Caudoviricetes sp.]
MSENNVQPKGMAGGIPVFCLYDKIVPVEDLKPNPKNPNHHPEDQVELLAKVIEMQGWRQPVKVSARSGYIVSGHGRYEAALLLGCPVPVDIQDYPSEAEELADLLADNRIAELAEMDEKMLAELFAVINDSDLSMEATGYEDDAAKALMEAIEKEPEIAGRVPFSEVLREEHNYIVLYYDNEVDWLQAQSIFGLETVSALSTRTDGKISKGSQRCGVGRVLRGADAMEAIRNVYQCELPVV